MTLPRPEENEAFSSYLFRFMSNFNAILEFPEEKTREAVAMVLYQNRENERSSN